MSEAKGMNEILDRLGIYDRAIAGTPAAPTIFLALNAIIDRIEKLENQNVAVANKG